MNNETALKIAELAEHLGCDADEIKVSSWNDLIFEYGDQEYLVLTDEEADEHVENYILDDLWAFRAEFIIDECDLDLVCTDSLRKMQETCYEGCNELIRALIDSTCGIDTFIYDAIACDGRGHFLASYDGHENETQHFYIYRMN